MQIYECANQPCFVQSGGGGGADIRIIQVEGEFEEMDNLRTKNVGCWF